MPTEGVWVSPEGKKTFIPLENNPEIFNTLIRKLGVSSNLGFHDVYSLDEPELLAMIPRPAMALIFITPAPMYYAVREADKTPLDTGTLTYDKSGDEEPIIWFKQTIGHTCGLMALIHSVANGEARAYLDKDSLLDRLLAEAVPLKPEPRAQVLYDSEKLEKAHMSVAFLGDSAAPQASEPNGHHFMAFVRGKDGHLWELEGGSDGPVDRGLLSDGADMLSDEALDKGIRKFIKYADGNLEFSIIALSKEQGSE